MSKTKRSLTKRLQRYIYSLDKAKTPFQKEWIENLISEIKLEIQKASESTDEIILKKVLEAEGFIEFFKYCYPSLKTQEEVERKILQLISVVKIKELLV